VSEAKPHPFDLSKLSKGSVIGPSEIEEVTGVKRGVKGDFSLALLRAGALLSSQWFGEREEIITTRCQGESLVICTDDEALEVNNRRSDLRVRGLRKDLARTVGIDSSKLSSDEKRNRRDRILSCRAAFLSAGKSAARVALKSHVRQTPGLGKVSQ